jgi:hypothetical protein
VPGDPLHFHVFAVGHAALPILGTAYAFARGEARRPAFALRPRWPFASAPVPAGARWRSGYAEDCKSFLGAPNSSKVRTL